MYKIIDSSGKQVVIYYQVYEDIPVKAKLNDLSFKTSGPIYDSKNSHKRTNKRKR